MPENAADNRLLTDPGTLLATVHELEEGSRVRLRLTRPSDAPRVRAFLEGLSPGTLHRRFFVAMPLVTADTVRHFTFYDPRRRLVVAATTFDEGGERILGLADVSLLETGLAELGIVVEDSVQRNGVGKLLTEAIASLAARRGATHLKAELLERNPGVERLMERLGRTIRTIEAGTAVLYTRLDEQGRLAA